MSLKAMYIQINKRILTYADQSALLEDLNDNFKKIVVLFLLVYLSKLQLLITVYILVLKGCQLIS
jgi:hypothetical protein